MKRSTLYPSAIVSVATVVALAGVAPAHSVPEGPLSIDTSTISQITTNDCAELAVTYYLATAPADLADWVVDGDIVDAAGASRGSVFEFETLPVTQASDTYRVCGLPFGTSTFTLAVDLRGYSRTLDNVYRGRYLKTFYVTRNEPPAPTVKGKSTLKTGKPALTSRRAHVQLGLSVKVQGCTEPRVLTLRGLKNANSARWIKIRTQKISASAYLRAKVPYKFTRVRAYLNEGAECKSAISRATTVRR